MSDRSCAGAIAGRSFSFSRTAVVVVPLCCIVLLAQSARAAQIHYGTHEGSNVYFTDVSEDSGASEPLPLFGPPTVTGNTIDFNPLGFDTASSGAGSDITSSNLQFGIQAKIGARIQNVLLNETGDTTLAGNVPPGSLATSSAVFASGVLDIYEVDFTEINHISVPFSLSFSPSGGTFFLGTDGGGGPLFHTQWSGSATLQVEAILVANGVAFEHGATRVAVNLTNTLSAVSESGTSSVMGKVDFGATTQIITVRNDIPEPAVVAVPALVFFTLRRRRCGCSL